MTTTINASNSGSGGLIQTADASGVLALQTAGITAVTVDTSQNVGIGTSSPSYKLQVVGASNSIATQIQPQGALPDNTDNAGLYVLHQGTAGAGFRVRTDNALTGSQFAHIMVNNASASINGFQVSQYGTGWIADFNKSGTTALRIDSSGNVGIGTTSPSSYGKFVVDNTGASTPVIYGRSGDQAGARIAISNTGVGGQTWNIVAGDVGVSNSGLSFYDVTNSATRMRIDSSGYLLVGYTTSNGAYKLQVNSQIFATSAIIATSDGKYKKDIQSLDGALKLVNQLNPVQFSWKQHPVHDFDTSTPTIGFIAQEVQQVLADKPYLNSIIKANECVIQPEEKDADGNVTKQAVTEEFLGIAEGNMIALLTKAIQEQQALITSLTARIAALEGTPA